MSWTNPPKAAPEPVAEKESPTELFWVHPLDFDRVTAYVIKLFARLKTEAEPFVIAKIPTVERQAMVLDRFDTLGKEFTEDFRVDAEIPLGYMRGGFEGQTNFRELKIVEYFKGLEDTKRVPEDMLYMKMLIVASGLGMEIKA